MAIDPVDLPTTITVHSKKSHKTQKIMLGGIGGDHAVYVNGDLQIEVPLDDGVKDEKALAFVEAVKAFVAASPAQEKHDVANWPEHKESTENREKLVAIAESKEVDLSDFNRVLTEVHEANQPEVTMEPFGQRFVGIVDTYPALSKSMVESAREHIKVEQHRDSVLISITTEFAHEMGTSLVTILKPTSLPAEHAWVLFIELQKALFGSNPDAGFTSKP